MTFQRVRLTDALQEMLTAALDPPPGGKNPVGVVWAPAGVTDGAGKLVKGHYILDPIASGRIEDDWDGESMPTLVYNVTAVGLNRKQAEWLADAARAVMVGRTNGRHTYPLTMDVGYVVDRSIGSFGGVMSESPGIYTVPDSYNLVVT